MKRFLPLLIALVLWAYSLSSGLAQLTPEEIAARKAWEDFLKTARIVDFSQPFAKREAVTEPFVLVMEQDGIQRRAIWKNPDDRFKIVDSWKYEIAAYRLDKLLNLNMICPTIEKRFLEDRGSCQLMAENVKRIWDMVAEESPLPPEKQVPYWRAIYLQRAFDNLIGNMDRNPGDILITEDFRVLLCDHSRAFRTSGKYAEQLIFDENSPGGPKPMEKLPRTFVEKIRALDQKIIREAVGEYLTDKEIRYILKRRNLILDWINVWIGRLGEDKVLY